MSRYTLKNQNMMESSQDSGFWEQRLLRDRRSLGGSIRFRFGTSSRRPMGSVEVDDDISPCAIVHHLVSELGHQVSSVCNRHWHQTVQVPGLPYDAHCLPHSFYDRLHVC